MKLTDEQINSIARGNHDGMLWKQDGGLGPALCEQAREAIRLREHFEAIKRELEEMGDINPDRLLRGINEILEGIHD